MPKKKKAGKNTKSAGTTVEKRKIIEADIDGQVYGIIEKCLGCRFFEVNCLDNIKRRCKARQKRLKVQVGDCVIVSIRAFDDKTSDIIYKYDAEEVRQMQKNCILPSSDVINLGNIKVDQDDDDDGGFSFENI